ncbi:isopenicillin N synthase family oxygenase [Nocardia panacis]|uniref:Isopenicillin N synthase family oxygenase n=1 Tax=Nocardia panacis TaxID=2340916 RepID=A0A3A4KB65_9NOCA|nr:2-oxoglutarate and iron-dependent oxygenase domain-containing protein [Nocardia panacis]RJO70841.1 isopenicillin N synthase family oxygenase [Nocardia panacis]
MSGASFTEVPIIDIGPLVVEHPNAADLARAVDEIGRACREVGFFYAANHGIAESEMAEVYEAARSFFALPSVEKMKLRLGNTDQFRGFVPLGGEVTGGKTDWHECLDLQPISGRDAETIAAANANRRLDSHPLDDPGQWPEALPEFRRTMMRAWDQRYRLGGRIAAGMALSLGLDEHYFQPYSGVELSDLRMVHYPPRAPGAAAPEPVSGEVGHGFGAHVDYGFLAILQQDAVGGLEVLNSAEAWVPAPHIPGTFLVNIGLMMQQWTNDKYPATWHRVQIPGNADRYSIPFFYEPNFGAVIAPLDICCDAENPPRYEPCQFGPYVVGRFATAYD